MAEELDITDNTFEEEDINATAMEPSAEETKTYIYNARSYCQENCSDRYVPQLVS